MKYSELSGLKKEELVNKLMDKNKEITEITYGMMKNEDKDTSQKRKIKKDIARIKTAMAANAKSEEKG